MKLIQEHGWNLLIYFRASKKINEICLFMAPGGFENFRIKFLKCISLFLSHVIVEFQYPFMLTWNFIVWLY